MTDACELAVNFVIGEEGDYSNDVADPGGETKWGIARAKHPEISEASWAAFSRADAIALYRRAYWEKVAADRLPWAHALCVFDAAVNEGVSATGSMLQQALRVKVDGDIGPQTINAADADVDRQEGLDRFMAFRAIRYSHDPNFQRDGLGWLTRLFRVRAKASEPLT